MFNFKNATNKHVFPEVGLFRTVSTVAEYLKIFPPMKMWRIRIENSNAKLLAIPFYNAKAKQNLPNES